MGTELGLEVDNEIIELVPEVVEEKEDPVEVEEISELENNEVNTQVVEVVQPDFDCPDAGFYPSPTDCSQYYQCTADKTVKIILFGYCITINIIN